MLPLEYCVGGFRRATCGCDLASSQLHFMDTLNAFFFDSLGSLEASKPRFLSIQPPQQHSACHLTAFFLSRPLPLLHGQHPLFLFCTEAQTAFFPSYFILPDSFSAVENGRKKNPELLVRLQIKRPQNMSD